MGRSTVAFATGALCTALVACSGGGITTPPPVEDVAVRVVTFGDSNTDIGFNGSSPGVVARSYVSRVPSRLGPGDPHDPRQLAGKIEATWKGSRSNPIKVVNHGIGGTTTGGGDHGGPDRNTTGGPQARTVVHGITRFEAEVLGHGAPEWDGGEAESEFYPGGPVRRSNAFVPGPHDFAYVSIGTNDPSSGIESWQTVENLTWMVQRWMAAGLPPSHFILTTLPPTIPPNGDDFPAINQAIRQLGTQTGIHVIDLAGYTSWDDGISWKSDELHIGDRLHYAESVRSWLATQVVDHMRSRIP